MTVRVDGREAGVEEALTRFTAPFNLTGLPALALPAGFTRSGLPTSLQLVAPAFAEGSLLAAGHAYQDATDWHRRSPALD
jgi:Asp-tRNA(Asn)/Glu-tRNA(Gln) amidotransferase A subunit family amidase